MQTTVHPSSSTRPANSRRAAPLELADDRLFPIDPAVRAVARRLYAEVRRLPIVSPHGHTDPRWFADDAPFEDPVSLLLTPDHYLFRMLYSAGVPLEKLGIAPRDGAPAETDRRRIWRTFAEQYKLFRGTPSRMWLDHVLHEVFGVRMRLGPESADEIYDLLAECLQRPEFRPRALFARFDIEVLSTTDSPAEPLRYHEAMRADGWQGRVVPAFRPDPVVDPEYEGFHAALAGLAELTGEDCHDYKRYIDVESLAPRVEVIDR